MKKMREIRSQIYNENLMDGIEALVRQHKNHAIVEINTKMSMRERLYH